MTKFWNFYIIFLVLVSFIFYSSLLYFTKYFNVENVGKDKTLSHDYDGIKEYNNQLPRWWYNTFWISIFWGCTYLFLYPGLGGYSGILKWTSVKDLNKEIEIVKEKYNPIILNYVSQPVDVLLKDVRFLKLGERIFTNNCSGCHGLNAKGAIGFPNLTINFWRYGGSIENIKETITNGRIGFMPPMGAMMKDENELNQVANYVMSISGYFFDEEKANFGEKKFKSVCSPCHGMDATGNKMIGAPNLNKGVRMYGFDMEALQNTIRNGRRSVMPSHKNLLSKEQIYVLSVYIYGLSSKNIQ